MMKKPFTDQNNPMVKWVAFLLKKFDIDDLVDDIIIGDRAPKNPEDAEKRLLSFFHALEERTGYTPDMAMKDIKRFLH